MNEYNTKITNMGVIPTPTVDGKKLSNTSAICNDGETAYILRTCGSSSDNKKYPFAIYKVSNFNTKPKFTLLNIKGGKAIHANDMTFVDGYIYVQTSNKKDDVQLIKISKDGKIKGEYKYLKGSSYNKIHGCTFAGKYNGELYFIVGISDTQNKKRYNLAKINGDTLVFANITYLSQEISDDYVANGIYYDPIKGRFYNTFYVKSTKGVIKKNHLFSYKLPDVFSSGQLVVNSDYTIKAPSEYNKKFELEDVVLCDNKKFIVCNCESSKGGNYNQDGLFKVTKK